MSAVLTSCSLGGGYRRFGETCCPHLQCAGFCKITNVIRRMQGKSTSAVKETNCGQALSCSPLHLPWSELRLLVTIGGHSSEPSCTTYHSRNLFMSTRKMESANSSETWESTDKNTRRHKPESKYFTNLSPDRTEAPFV